MSTRRATKWLNKARRISNTISDLKEEDRKEWTRDYYSDTRTAVGPRFQNLGKYLKTRRKMEAADRRVRGLGTTSEKQYRTRARERVERIDEIEAEELASRERQARAEQRRQRWLDPVWRAELARDIREEHARTYEDDIEVRLERVGLNILAIETADLESRAGLYARRWSLAQEMLAEADARLEEMEAEFILPLTPTSPSPPRWRHYDPDEGWGRKHKYKRTHKNKTKKAKKKKKKKKREK